MAAVAGASLSDPCVLSIARDVNMQRVCHLHYSQHARVRAADTAAASCWRDGLCAEHLAPSICTCSFCKQYNRQAIRPQPWLPATTFAWLGLAHVVLSDSGLSAGQAHRHDDGPRGCTGCTEQQVHDGVAADAHGAEGSFGESTQGGTDASVCSVPFRAQQVKALTGSPHGCGMHACAQRSCVQSLCFYTWWGRGVTAKA